MQSRRLRAASGLGASALTTLGLLVSAPPARAELAYFANGRSLSIKAHRIEGNQLTLTLRSGGEVLCDPSTVTRFEPDEVPYPEPETDIRPAEPQRLERVLYGEIIDKVAARQGVDARLVRAVITVESAYRQSARSKRGAMGLMQLMPDTARLYAVSNPYDPESNIEAGIKHLKMLLQRLPLELALAAYNAGEAAVQKFRGMPPYPETRAYVARILQLVSSR